MKYSLYLDSRKHRADDQPAPLYFRISRAGQNALLPLGISLPPSRWDAALHRCRQLPLSQWPQRRQTENFISSRFSQLESLLLELEQAGSLHALSAAAVRDLMLDRLHPAAPAPALLLPTLHQFALTRRAPRTRELYLLTEQKLRLLLPDSDSLPLSDITPQWLGSLSSLLMRSGLPSANARAIHLRNIRAAMNWAIDNGLTNNYPFRRFRIEQEKTRKRDLTADQLRQFLAVPITDSRLTEYRDLFLLSFLLIGISPTDLFSLRPDSLSDGRIRYTRAKTGAEYDIRVEPEALDIIARHRGTDWLVSVRDRYRDPHDYLKHIGAGLKRILPEPPFSLLSLYWARHSWASIAYNDLSLPVDTISLALGHRYGSRVTAIYINPDTAKIDAANRAVIDWVLYGRKQA